MRNTAKFLWAGVFALLIAVGVQAAAGQAPAQAPQQPTFRVNVDLVTTDVIVRDSKTDQFMADLKPTDFDIMEDGVKQDLASMVLIDRKSTRLNSSHSRASRMPSSA